MKVLNEKGTEFCYLKVGGDGLYIENYPKYKKDKPFPYRFNTRDSEFKHCIDLIKEIEKYVLILEKYIPHLELVIRFKPERNKPENFGITILSYTPHWGDVQEYSEILYIDRESEETITNINKYEELFEMVEDEKRGYNWI